MNVKLEDILENINLEKLNLKDLALLLEIIQTMQPSSEIEVI